MTAKPTAVLSVGIEKEWVNPIHRVIVSIRLAYHILSPIETQYLGYKFGT